MTTTIVKRAPQVRCWKCGSAENPDSMCHHCHRVMCLDHRPYVPDSPAKSATVEFAGLGVDDWHPHHCTDCDHVVRARPWKAMAGGGTVAAAGIAVAFVNSGVGVLAVLVGASILAVALVVDQRRRTATLRDRPALPLVPNIDTVRLRETLNGRLTLDEHGRYDTSVNEVEGEFALTMTFGRADLDRLDRYRRKYRFAPDENVEFSAGIAVLRGPVGLAFDDRAEPSTTVELSGAVNDHPFFRQSDKRPSPQWIIERSYRLTNSPNLESIPIWITPTLAPESDQRTLVLELQWIDFGPDEDRELHIDAVEPLRLLVPPSWGEVDGATNSPSIGLVPNPDGGTSRLIEWRQIKMDRGAAANRRCTLSVRFEKEIGLHDVIKGNLAVSFKGALSGVSGVGIFHPLGWRRREFIDQRVTTWVNAEFELSLAGVRYQDVRVVPDRHRAEDAARDEILEFAAVIPDYKTVSWLTNVMSDNGYYVKRVIENPPRSSNRPNVDTRYWDIAGRRYDSVYPIDFHIVLTGEEEHSGELEAHTGTTRARITVRGTYANAAMADQVEQEWERLHELTVETLKQRTTIRSL